jgi:hypothetical protein
MSENRSIQVLIVSGARVSNRPTFVPAHVDQSGYLVTDRVNVPVCINSRTGRKDYVNLTIWGELARRICLFAPQGKLLNFRGRLTSFEKRVWHNRQPVTIDGTALTTMGVAIAVDELSFGDDSARQVALEEEWYRQNPGFIWGRPSRENAEQFAAHMKQRGAIDYNGTDDAFGFADVRKPDNCQFILNQQQRAQERNQRGSLGYPLAVSKKGSESTGAYAGAQAAPSGQAAPAAAGPAPAPSTGGYPANASTVGGAFNPTGGAAPASTPQTVANAAPTY